MSAARKPMRSMAACFFTLAVALWHSQTAAQTNLLQNPGFESGPTAWTGVATNGLPIIFNDPREAHTGNWVAWLGGYVSGTDTISQAFSIPASAQQARLRFWYRITTTAGTSIESDRMRVAIIDPPATVSLAQLAILSNRDATSGWVQSPSYDLSAFRGSTVRLQFQAINDSGNATSFFIDDVAVTTESSTAANYSDIWWNPNESGWGLTIADHETQMFAVWFTYLPSGRPTWFVAPGGTLRDNRRFFDADLYSTTGPPYNAPFDPSLVRTTKVGTMTLDFQPPGLAAGWARFSYTVNGVAGAKNITRQPFGNAVPMWGSDFTDIWWNPWQSGWGLTLAQHGDNIFGVLFIYDTDGQPLFVVMPGATIGTSQFSDTLYTTNSGGQGWSSPPDGQVNVAYPLSCFCSPPPAGVNDLCTGGVNPTGGQPPYRFRLDSGGGFQPFGITLHPNGCLSGTPTAAGSRTFSVCAIDQTGTSVCRPVQMNIRASRACAGGFTTNVIRGGCGNGFVAVLGGVSFEGVNFNLTTGSQTGTLTITGYPLAFTGCTVSSSTTATVPFTVNYATRYLEFNTIDGRFGGNYNLNAGLVAGRVFAWDRYADFNCAPPG